MTTVFESEKYKEEEAQPAPPPEAPEESLSLDDFVGYMPANTYIFLQSGEMWPASSVNHRVPPITEGGKTVPASTWISRHQPVEQMVWAPGEPAIIKHRLLINGGWVHSNSVHCFNLYKPPAPQDGGNPNMANPWVEHIRTVYPEEAEHIINWLAQRVQHPAQKINHAIVLGGSPGIGKDTLLEPVKLAVGPWNFAEITPIQAVGRFNEFLKSIVIRVSEARDMGEYNRYGFYELMKPVTAAPPDSLRVDSKHTKEYNILNCCGVVYTTNNKDGLYLPEDDRRHFVAWSNLTKEAFHSGYWNGLWQWYEGGGCAHVAAFLAARDLSGFDPKAPPPRTDAFFSMVNMHRSEEDIELSDVLSKMHSPDAVTIEQLMRAANRDNVDFGLWLQDRRNRRSIPHRLERCGMTSVRNPDRKSGLWLVAGSERNIYVKARLSRREQLAAAAALTR